MSSEHLMNYESKYWTRVHIPLIAQCSIYTMQFVYVHCMCVCIIKNSCTFEKWKFRTKGQKVPIKAKPWYRSKSTSSVQCGNTQNMEDPGHWSRVKLNTQDMSEQTTGHKIASEVQETVNYSQEAGNSSESFPTQNTNI